MFDDDDDINDDLNDNLDDSASEPAAAEETPEEPENNLNSDKEEAAPSSIDGFEKFDSERSWETLQLARATVAIAKFDIQQSKMPALKMTASDKKDFMKRLY